MANVLSLAMKINADASGFKLDPVQRALQGLAKEADKVTKVFDEFAGSSEAAARAQAKTAADLEQLTKARQAGTITAQEFEKQFNAIASAADQEAAALRRAAQITEASLTPQQKYQRTVAELKSQLDAGRISQETYAASLAKTKATLDSTTASVDAQKLKFNELSGVLAALPGPFGSIAGRISGLSSAGEGLARVFSGGLRQGFSTIGASLVGLVNPLTVATAGLAAFAAAARSIGAGLTQLEDRVEKLGNTADKLGISFGFVQVLDEAARRSGTSIEAVSVAFGRLQKSVLGVDEESKAAQAALAQIGVTAQQLQALKPEEQYRLIGQRIAAIEDPARRTATSINLFGRAGADLIPFFRNIGGAADDLDRVGAALDDAQRRDIDEFGGAMDRLTVATRGAGEQILASFAPAGETIANALAQVSGAVAKYVQEQNKISTIRDELAKLENINIRRAQEDEEALIRSGLTADEVVKRQQIRQQVLKETGKQWLDLRDAVIEAAVAEQNATKESEAAAIASAELATKFAADNQALFEKAKTQVAQFGSESVAVTLQYEEALRNVAELIAEEGLSEEQAARARANVTAEYERQMDAVKLASDAKRRAADEAARLAKQEADAIQSIIDKTLEQIRVERDFGGDTARARNAADLQRITDEIARAEAEIAKANASGDERNSRQAAARLAQLDQVRAALAETEAEFSRRAEEVAQGFADGFSQAFDETARGINDLIAKTAQFGDEGAQAAKDLQDGIAEAQLLVSAGFLAKPAYDAEVAAQRQLAEERLAQLDREAKFRQQRIDEDFQRQVAANDRLNQFMLGQMTERQRAEAAAVEEAFKRREQAAENLQVIEERIALQRRSIEAAREANDLRAAKARQDELRALEKLRITERSIVDSRADANRQINRVANAAQQSQLAQQQIIANTAQRQIAATEQASRDAVGQVNNAFAEAAERQRKLLDDLRTLGSRTVQTADVRTQEGAAIILGLAANAQDPRLIEAKQANKFLKNIATSTAGYLNRIGLPATILG